MRSIVVLMNRNSPYNMRGRFFRNVYTSPIFILRLVINFTKLFKFFDNPKVHKYSLHKIELVLAMF